MLLNAYLPSLSPDNSTVTRRLMVETGTVIEPDALTDLDLLHLLQDQNGIPRPK